MAIIYYKKKTLFDVQKFCKIKTRHLRSISKITNFTKKSFYHNIRRRKQYVYYFYKAKIKQLQVFNGYWKNK